MKLLAAWKRICLLLFFSVSFSVICVALSGWFLTGFAKEARDGFQKYFSAFLYSTDESVLRERTERMRLARAISNMVAFRVWIVDDSGRVVATTETDPLPLHWETAPKPAAANESTLVNQEKWFGQHSLFGQQLNIFRMDGPKPLYMVNATLPPGSFAKRMGKVALFYFLLNIAGNAVLGSLGYVLISRWKAKQASEVLAEFGKGNLKARFPMSRADDLGHLMAEFNRMAEAIEESLTKLRHVEAARRTLLQDINHDFRTPLATLGIVIERLGEYHDQMPSDKRAQAIAGVARELDYLKRLTEFLFTLAESDEPAYRVSFETQNLEEILESEISLRRSAGVKALEWKLESSGVSCLVDGDRSLLLRLVRNGLDNAAKFARRRVTVRVGAEGNHWVVTLLDDGPGPSAEGLARFGNRKPVSLVALTLNPSESAGLGSVIMKAIASLHGGTVELQARRDGATGGALLLRLPRSADTPALLSA